MKAQTLLRTASAIALVQFVGHGALFIRARPTHGADEVAVVEAMRAHFFQFGMAPRSYWDMYFGYGLEAAFICLVEAVLLFQLAGVAERAATVVRPVTALIVLANLAHFAMLARYFAFPIPMVLDAVLVTTLALTWKS